MRVTRVRAADDIKHQRSVRDRAAHRADVRKAPGGAERIDRNASKSGLETNHAGESGRSPDRAAGIRAKRERGHSGRKGGAGSAARPARSALEIPRVPGDAEERVIGHAKPAVIGRIRLADDDRARGLQPLNRGRVVLGHEIRLQPRAGGSPHAGGANHVLD